MSTTAKLHIGQRVLVFNQVSDSWLGFVRALNKTMARVECERKHPPFTNHNDARAPWDDGRHFLVPYHDISDAPPNHTPST